MTSFSDSLRKWGMAKQVFFCLLLCSLLIMLSACPAKKEPPKDKPPVLVTVAASVRKDVPVQLKAIGTIEAFNTVSIKAQVNGQVAKVHFREGQDIRKGELLFTIDPRPFEMALKQAEATLAKDQAQVRYAHEQVRRYTALLKDGIISQDQYDQVRSTADAFDATVAGDRATVENARLLLSYCSIRSPIDGRTGNLAVQVGNLVKANDVPVLVTINQISPIHASFAVPEKELPDIKRYLAAGQLKVQAIVPNDPKGPENGSLSFLDNAVDSATGTIRLKGTFPNTSGRLWPGQFVNVVLTLTTRGNAVVIPGHAVQTGQQGQFVFVVKSDSTAESRPISIGLIVEGETVVEKGLNPGETVVTDGQLRLLPGAKVEVKTAQVAGKEQTGPAGIAAGR